MSGIDQPAPPIDLQDPAVRAWLEQQRMLELQANSQPYQAPQPEWTNSNGGGYQPSDIGSQNSQLGFQQAQYSAMMDPMRGAMAGTLSPDAFAPRYETNTISEGSDVGRRTLENIIARSNPDAPSLQAIMAGLMLDDGMSGMEAYATIEAEGLVPPPKPKLDQDGNQLTNTTTGEPLYEDAGIGPDLRKWADKSWNTFMGDQDAVTEQTEIPSELKQKFLDAGYQSDPSQQYTPDVVMPELQGYQDLNAQYAAQVAAMREQGPESAGRMPQGRTAGGRGGGGGRLGGDRPGYYVQPEEPRALVNTSRGGRDALNTAPSSLNFAKAMAAANPTPGKAFGSARGEVGLTGRSGPSRGGGGSRARAATSGRSTEDARAEWAAKDAANKAAYDKQLKNALTLRQNSSTNLIKQQAEALATARFLQRHGRTPWKDENAARGL